MEPISIVKHDILSKELTTTGLLQFQDPPFVKEDNNYAQKCLKMKTDKLIRNVYKELDHLHKYKGKTLLAADTSIITLSNHTTY